MKHIFEKDLSGVPVSPNEPGYDELIAAIMLDIQRQPGRMRSVASFSKIFSRLLLWK